MPVSPYRPRGPVMGSPLGRNFGPGTGTVGPVSRPSRPYLGRGSTFGAADPPFKKSQQTAANQLRGELKKQLHGRGPRANGGATQLKNKAAPAHGHGPRRRNSVMKGRSRGKPFRSY
jgi:hypothetical protein